MTATDCLELRGRLAENAVSTLPERERREVERHLEWCAGCRKEARELQEGAAMAGLSLPTVEPPRQLEDSVIESVQRAATRGRPSRSRFYLRRGVTVLAAVIGLLGVSLAGILFAQQQSAEKNHQFTQLNQQQTIQHLRQLYLDLRKRGQSSTVSQVVLTPTPGHAGIGGALLVTPTSSRFTDQLFVLVSGLDRAGAPYRVWVAGPDRQRFMIPGFMTPDVGGGGEIAWPGMAQRTYTRVEVRDVKGRVVLAGTFPRAP